MCYDIRLCEISEINIVLEFIDKYWKKDHIFLHRKDLLDWQHRESNHYNFVIAVHRKEKTIHGILGFISPTFFASGNVVKNDDIWLAIWKVEKELTSSNSVGIDLLNYIKENYTPSSISAIGINQNVANLYKIFLGFQLAKMNHYYLLNREKERYNIAKINRILQI